MTHRGGDVSDFIKNLDEDRLTPRQREFVKHFLENPNATEAYARSYPSASRKTAARGAKHNLHNPKIISAIEKIYQKQGITEDYVKSSAMVYVELGKLSSAYAGPGVSALGHLGKTLKMFDDGPVKPSFINVVRVYTGENVPSRSDDHSSSVRDYRRASEPSASDTATNP